MTDTDLTSFLKARPEVLKKGPLAVILAEDLTEIDSTLRHHIAAGFRGIVLLAPPEARIPADLEGQVSRVTYSAPKEGPVTAAVTRMMRYIPEGTWLYYGHNAEYLFHPFCESRTVGEMLAFHTEERRASMVATVVDLYAPDLQAHPDAVDRDSAEFDAHGYYALAREDPDNGYAPLDRQVDIFGGLRWRYEEHVPWKKRRIDRVALFRARRGLVLRDDFTLNDPELNTLQCAWHHNLTACVASFRTAKALRALPGPRRAIDSFRWFGSRKFEWTGQQLLDLGLMEPGQWF